MSVMPTGRSIGYQYDPQTSRGRTLACVLCCERPGRGARRSTRRLHPEGPYNRGRPPANAHPAHAARPGRRPPRFPPPPRRHSAERMLRCWGSGAGQSHAEVRHPAAVGRHRARRATRSLVSTCALQAPAFGCRCPRTDLGVRPNPLLPNPQSPKPALTSTPRPPNPSPQSDQGARVKDPGGVFGLSRCGRSVTLHETGGSA
jgi:hypothetical protein